MKKKQPDLIEAKEIQMTEADFAKVSKNMDKVLYAEWAETGAQGYAGYAHLYYLDGDDFILYVAKWEKENDLYSRIYNLIIDNCVLLVYSESTNRIRTPTGAYIDVKGIKKREHEYFERVGLTFGNFVWKKKGIKFYRYERRDIVEFGSGFIYKDGGKSYLIRCTVLGVYDAVKDACAPLASHEKGRDAKKEKMTSKSTLAEIDAYMRSYHHQDIERGYALYQKYHSDGLVSCRQFLGLLEDSIYHWSKEVSAENTHAEQMLFLIRGVKKREIIRSQYAINSIINSHNLRPAEAVVDDLMQHENDLISYTQLEDTIIELCLIDDVSMFPLPIIREVAKRNFVNMDSLLARLKKLGLWYTKVEVYPDDKSKWDDVTMDYYNNRPYDLP